MIDRKQYLTDEELEILNFHKKNKGIFEQIKKDFNDNIKDSKKENIKKIKKNKSNCYIRLDGTLIELKPKDLDGNGLTGDLHPEQLSRSSFGEINATEPTELGESLRELNDDTISSENRMSGIDMRTRLNMFEIPPILSVDSLVGFKFLPIDCLTFTRQKKRLNVSQDGEGRREMCEIIGGKKENDIRKSGGVTNFLGLPQK